MVTVPRSWRKEDAIIAAFCRYNARKEFAADNMFGSREAFAAFLQAHEVETNNLDYRMRTFAARVRGSGSRKRPFYNQDADFEPSAPDASHISHYEKVLVRLLFIFFSPSLVCLLSTIPRCC